MSSDALEMTRTGPVLRLTPEAREFVRSARDGEAGSDGLALFVEVSGTDGGAYTYDMWFESAANAGPEDAVEDDEGLVVVVVSSSIAKLEGATLDLGQTGGEPGLVMVNPNAPEVDPHRAGPPPDADLTSPVALAVITVLEQEINPQIAAHGGRADLVAVDGGIAYLRLGGGCQGCGLAQVTLSQGISVAIKEAVPEIVDVVDVTSHAAGTNPYYEAAKK